MTPATPTLQRIVAGVDSSDNAARAASWAAGQAIDLAIPLLLVHALDLGATSVYSTAAGYVAARRESGARLLGDLGARLRDRFPGLLLETELSDIDAAQTLIALSEQAALTVTGTRGHGGFAGLLLGSVSLKLAAHSHGPAIVVRGEEPGEPLNEIVLGVQPEEHDAPIRFAFDTAARFGATLHVVRAWWPPAFYGGYYVDDTDMTADSQETEALTLIKGVREEYPQVRVTVESMRGNAVPMLIEAARGSRLLVIGAHRHRSPLSVGAGYVVQGLLSHSPTPVAVIP
ncbi:MAG: universal stress protein, partial [Actinocrinis sp.]